MVLDGVDLDVRPGELLAVTGRSGAGKTTLLLSLAMVEPPDGGSVALDGSPVVAGSARVGLVPQDLGLVALLTAAENVELAMQAARRPRKEIQGAAQDALVDVGLAKRTEHLVDELSGGEQQRVAVARALALAPDLLLADEPTSQLDAENRARVLDALHRAALRGTAVVLTTHDDDVAARCERVLHLEGGRLA